MMFDRDLIGSDVVHVFFHGNIANTCPLETSSRRNVVTRQHFCTGRYPIGQGISNDDPMSE